ncbi:uncharacterized protein LOC117118975 [Anneissia japonica]|uniref:uncharacterized protein LOC117118975 n=1 Tax=Anneissia japonica TaxID=1529436 RepID=UPI00142551E7|nr:uncharacterized protein LOC117118975 [Anneissia japonica]
MKYHRGNSLTPHRIQVALLVQNTIFITYRPNQEVPNRTSPTRKENKEKEMDQLFFYRFFINWQEVFVCVTKSNIQEVVMMNPLKAVGVLMITLSSIAVIRRTLSTNPGQILMKIAQCGLQWYVNKFGRQNLNKTLAKIQIPDRISDKTRIAVGEVSYELKNLKIEYFLPDASISTISEYAIEASIVNNATLSIHGDWSYCMWLWIIPFRDHGSIDVTVSSITISPVIRFGKNNSVVYICFQM